MCVEIRECSIFYFLFCLISINIRRSSFGVANIVCKFMCGQSTIIFLSFSLQMTISSFAFWGPFQVMMNSHQIFLLSFDVILEIAIHSAPSESFRKILEELKNIIVGASKWLMFDGHWFKWTLQFINENQRYVSSTMTTINHSCKSICAFTDFVVAWRNGFKLFRLTESIEMDEKIPSLTK